MRTEEKILAILRVGHVVSKRGEGLSLRNALFHADYVEARKHFDAQDLLSVILKRRELIEQWLRYSEDKRTSGGWYLMDTGEVGRADEPNEPLNFGSIEEAVAEYVVRELDDWAAVYRVESDGTTRCGDLRGSP